MNFQYTEDEIVAFQTLIAGLTAQYWSEDEDPIEEVLLMLDGYEQPKVMQAVMFGSILALIDSLCDLTEESAQEFIQRLGLLVAEASGQ